MIFDVLILISVLAFIGAVSAIISETKRRKRAAQKWKKFEEEHPPKRKFIY